jgi:hypothetical protein
MNLRIIPETTSLKHAKTAAEFTEHIMQTVEYENYTEQVHKQENHFAKDRSALRRLEIEAK